MKFEREAKLSGEYDIIVAGGGVAGAAAAVAARRMGKSVLLIEKTIGLRTGNNRTYKSVCSDV